MVVDRTHRLWLGALNAHVRAVHAHEIAAAFSARTGDTLRAEIESQRAAAERIAYARAAARHPEWSGDVSVGLMGVRAAGAGAVAGYATGRGDR
jgi:hypothetical protein